MIQDNVSGKDSPMTPLQHTKFWRGEFTLWNMDAKE
jgi:hypothetical protein